MKPAADVARTLALLRQIFADDAAGARPLAGGVFSRAYAFTAGDQDYVIRLNTAAHAAEGFAKDDYAWRHFASPALPIPRVFATGEADGVQFAISELAPGRTLEALSADERRAALPSLLDTLDAIAHTDVSASQGYGDWGGDGQGRYARWHDYLAAVIENESEGFYQDWHALFHDSFLDRDAYEAIYRHMLRLAARCPEERALLHNDYWYENVLAMGERVTGVIDWANALYGDPLYDVARLSWGAAWPGWWYEDGADFLRARYGATPGYAERLACYQCHIGLDDLRYYATVRNREQYTRTRDRLLARVAGAADED
ncbi:MAG: phosphotransferase family protein [Thermomicrobiales bacterium]